MIKRMSEKKFRELDTTQRRKDMIARIQFAKELFRGAKIKIVKG
jgi:hypothetical protein